MNEALHNHSISRGDRGGIRAQSYGVATGRGVYFRGGQIEVHRGIPRLGCAESDKVIPIKPGQEFNRMEAMEDD